MTDRLGRPGRILIVDDEPNVRFVFRATLESTGYRVDEAEVGAETLERIRNITFDLVLLDLQMPDLNGPEVLRRIRDEGHAVPVVIVTAHGDTADALSAMHLGAADLLHKPLIPDVLRRVASEVIESHGRPVSETSGSSIN